jgi:hypothetical protein
VRTEHQLLKAACRACGTHTRAELPAGVERGAFGPRLRATVVMLAAMLMSRRATALMLADMFGAKLSTGSVEKILKDASATLAEPWEAIKRAVQAGDVAHADETSWRRAGERMWLWAALSATAACFAIDQTRARTVAQDVLGDFDAILVSDRYGVYAMLDPAHRQICHAHLARNFAAHADRPGAPGRHATPIKALIDQVMAADRRAREHDRRLTCHDGELRPVHDDLMDALEAGERGRTPELATLCANVLDLWPALWSFTEHADVKATNNRASARSVTPSYGATRAPPPRPPTATASSSGSSRFARPVAARTSRCTPTSPMFTTPASAARRSRCHSTPPDPNHEGPERVHRRRHPRLKLGRAPPLRAGIQLILSTISTPQGIAPPSPRAAAFGPPNALRSSSSGPALRPIRLATADDVHDEWRTDHARHTPPAIPRNSQPLAHQPGIGQTDRPHVPSPVPIGHQETDVSYEFSGRLRNGHRRVAAPREGARPQRRLPPWRRSSC